MAPNLQTIPVPSATVQSHASNLLQLPDKTVLCTWFGGSQEGLPDISIWLSRLEPGSPSWTSPQKISFDENRSCQNPVLFRAPHNGDIWLLHTSQDAGNQDGAYILKRTSPDQGRTWSEASRLLPNVTGIFIRQPIVINGSGTWILPVFYCRTEPGHRWIGSDDISGVLY
ncbi:neuraminidase (sialidase) [Fusarium subglutinans]|uniref:Neuraminidase (Sialidase) n=1 Tax=Gibberella subglutinans TaxID=42677 RepID=A0A8H5L7E6_GIBSU|nr:neuraminidase (sialidase) [Fusarium subglutinans]KAF5586144.1 neuraminidase (sialidase) [Fusarium subglutinans]